MWTVFSLNDIVQRYRGSVLGPFWIVLTSAAFIIGVGLVYSQIMKVPANDYVPWIGAGVIVWNLINGVILEGADAFISSGVFLRQSATPLPTVIWRVVLRNLIVFAHQMVVVIATALYFGYFFQINVPMAIVGLVLVTFNLSWVAMAAAIISARFRDVQQALATALQMVFFLTPVIWIPSQVVLGRHLLEINPAFHMLQALRQPLIGEPTAFHSLFVLLGMGVAGWVVTFLFYSAVRRRIVHYI